MERTEVLRSIRYELFEYIQKRVNDATLDDVIRYQALVDNRILQISDLTPQKLFEIKQIEWNEPPVELAGVYRKCSCCGELVLEERLIEQNGERYCIPCFRSIKVDCVC